MGTFKANRGNLMQHWLTCEIAAALLGRFKGQTLTYCDAHAMAPESTPESCAEAEFAAMAESLTAAPATWRTRSLYQEVWHKLAGRGMPYPSSARYVEAIWQGPLRCVLCEVQPQIVSEIQSWAEGRNVVVRQGRWQDRLSFPADADLVFAQFDPYEIHTVAGRNRDKDGVMYPEDFDRLEEIGFAGRGPLVLQISSYRSTGIDLAAQAAWTRQRLGAMGLRFDGGIRADGAMFSMIFSCRLELPSLLPDLGDRFATWAKAWGVGNKPGPMP